MKIERRINSSLIEAFLIYFYYTLTQGRTTNLQWFKLRLGSETKDAGGRLRNISHLTTGDLREPTPLLALEVLRALSSTAPCQTVQKNNSPLP